MGRDLRNRSVDAADWFDDRPILGHLVLAVLAGLAVAGSGLALGDEQLVTALVSGTVAFAVAVVGVRGWWYLFRRAERDT